MSDSIAVRPRVATVLWRGLQRRCPRCGEGPLFRRGISAYERCSACSLLFERNYGDTWMYTIITDRIPIFLGIVAWYFGFRATNWVAATLFFVAMAVPLIATISHRQGLAIALDYLSRLYLPDPSDEIHGGRVIPSVSEGSGWEGDTRRVHRAAARPDPSLRSG